MCILLVDLNIDDSIGIIETLSFSTNCTLERFYKNTVYPVTLVLFHWCIVESWLQCYRLVRNNNVVRMTRSRRMRIAFCFSFIFTSAPRHAVFWACIYSVVSFASTSRTMAPNGIVPALRSSRTIRSVSATGNILITSCGLQSPCSR